MIDLQKDPDGDEAKVEEMVRARYENHKKILKDSKEKK
jgi:hypothetical protein